MSPVWCKVSFWKNTEQPEIQTAHRSFNSPNNLHFCRVRGQKHTTHFESIWEWLLHFIHSTVSAFIISKWGLNNYIAKIILLYCLQEDYSSDYLFDLGQLKTQFFSVSIEVTASCLGEGEPWLSPALSINSLILKLPPSHLLQFSFKLKSLRRW